MNFNCLYMFMFVYCGNISGNKLWHVFFYNRILLRLSVGRGGVINSPRSVFLGFFRCHKLGYRSWVIPLCILLSEPTSPRLLNSISSKLCHQNTQFNMHTTTSKQQEGSTCKDSYPKCFITTNFDKFHREGR